MKKEHVVLDFIKIPFAHKIEVGRNVESQMESNSNFATPDVTLINMKAGTDLLEVRYVASLSGGKVETALLHQADDAWVDLMRTQAYYVDRIANGDSAVILSSGFNLAKQPSPSNRPEFSVELGEMSGSVVLRRQKVVGSRSYIWQYFLGEIPANEADWTTAQVTSQASVVISGLLPLNKYWFRVAAVTITGTSAYCSPVMQVVI